MTELDKYQGIYANPERFPKYGHSNHGRGAARLLTKWQPASVLDVGCGWNEFAGQMREEMPGARIVGVDFACPGADVIAPLTALPFADKEFDTITAFDVLEHLRPDEVDAALAEMARVSGRFIVSISYVPSVNKWQGQNLHPTVRPEEWWMIKLMQAGAAQLAKHGRYIVGSWRAKLPIQPADSVVLVGNGPSIVESKLGAAIDEHTHVVRFNNYQIAGFEQHTGERTTLWSTFFKRIDQTARDVPVFCIHENDQVPERAQPVYRLPMVYYQRINAELHRRADWKHGFQRDPERKLLATSGLLVLAYLLEVVGVQRVTLAGFDHFDKSRTGMHHYWLKQSFKRPPEHNGDLERQMFAELRQAGRIEYLAPTF